MKYNVGNQKKQIPVFEVFVLQEVAYNKLY